MRVGSLFTGYGGLDLAVEEAFPDTDLAWVADNDPDVSTLLAHRYSGIPNLGDVTAVDWTTVEPVHVLTGGTPCQDVSHAGHRRGMTEGTRSNLWVAMRAAIEAIRPALVVWENVRGVVSAHASTDLEHCPRCMGDPRPDQPRLRALGRVLGDLAELGYDAAWHHLRATDVGAPHLRSRIFLLAWPAGQRPAMGAHPAALPGRGTDVVLMGTPAASIYRGAGGIGSASHTARLARSYLDAQATQLASDRLLPTPVVNDMGAGKTVDWWDDWAPRQRAADGSVAVHGPSLSIEAMRLLPTPGAYDAERGGPVPVEQRKAGGHAVNLQDVAATLPTPTATDARASGGNKPSNVTLTDATVRNLEAWGKYATAIDRWERILGRPAPAPTEPSPNDNARLSPRFVEWMMGLPDGWVTGADLDLGYRAQLRLLGNGVLPAQGTAALAYLATVLENAS